jgi:hypothetical protein
MEKLNKDLVNTCYRTGRNSNLLQEHDIAFSYFVLVVIEQYSDEYLVNLLNLHKYNMERVTRLDMSNIRAHDLYHKFLDHIGFPYKLREGNAFIKIEDNTVVDIQPSIEIPDGYTVKEWQDINERAKDAGRRHRAERIARKQKRNNR